VCFYEPKEPKKFEHELSIFSNLHCRSTPSGKFTSSLQEHWLEDIFLPSIGDNSVLVIDEWSGYKRPMEIEAVKKKALNVRVIPAGATPYLQPEDVRFNRQWKQMLRYACLRIRHHNPEFIVSIRKNQAALISFVHRQFCAPRFRDFIKMAWYKSGYYVNEPPACPTPYEYCCTDYLPNSKCPCGTICFARCAYCEQLLCFQHFILQENMKGHICLSAEATGQAEIETTLKACAKDWRGFNPQKRDYAGEKGSPSNKEAAELPDSDYVENRLKRQKLEDETQVVRDHQEYDRYLGDQQVQIRTEQERRKREDELDREKKLEKDLEREKEREKDKNKKCEKDSV
jgi:hypothetical protein